MENSTQILIDNISKWFKSQQLDTAVIGFSGGIDSATTAALCSAAGIRVELIQCYAVEDDYVIQSLSSSYYIGEFAEQYKMGWDIYDIPINIDSNNYNTFNEAALPIMRVAYLYGKAAQLREHGYKPCVVGTVNFDEAAYLGFWGKSSDAAQDFYPISHLHKSNVYKIAKELNIPQEIIDAIPSGDLLWSGDLNDYKMIGATYDQIESIVKRLEGSFTFVSFKELSSLINTVDNPKLFIDNIMRNRHKYERPFPGFHINDRLEKFRRECYPTIRSAAEKLFEANVS